MKRKTTQKNPPQKPAEPSHEDPSSTLSGGSSADVGLDEGSRSDSSRSGWSGIEKLTAVVECASLTPSQRADYCHQSEVSEETVALWRQQCITPEFWTCERGKSCLLVAVEAMSYIETLEKELLETGDILMEAWIFYTNVKKALLSVPPRTEMRRISL